MSAPRRAPRYSTRGALLVGVAAGLAVLAVYLGAGLLAGGWDVDAFLAHLSVSTLRSLAVTGGLVVASVALPVALYLHARLVAPLAVLVLVAGGWFAYGALTGVLTGETVFGFALYLLFLSPVVLAVSLLFGGGEYVLRDRGRRS